MFTLRNAVPFKFLDTLFKAQPTRSNHLRTSGKPSPAGTKLARQALERRLTLRHGRSSYQAYFDQLARKAKRS